MSPARRKEDRERRQIEPYGRIVQVVAIIAFVVMLFIDLSNPHEEIDWMYYGGMLGIAWGAKPNDIRKLFGTR